MTTTTTDPAGAAVLACPMTEPNDADASTIREYLAKLLHQLWVEKEGFSGKRPLGNSGWEGELEAALVRGGFVEGHVDEDGYVIDADDAMVGALMKAAIAEMGAPAAAVAPTSGPGHDLQPQPERPIPLSSLPGRGGLIAHEGRTYLINEVDFAVRDPDPGDAAGGWIRAQEVRGVLRAGFRAIEVDEPQDGGGS